MEKDSSKVSLWRLSGRVLALAIVVSVIGGAVNFVALQLVEFPVKVADRNPSGFALNVAWVYPGMILASWVGLIALCMSRPANYFDYSPRELALASQVSGLSSIICCGFLTVPAFWMTPDNGLFVPQNRLSARP